MKIIIHPHWLRRPPIAFCYADFIRQELDWHVQSNGSLCYVLVQEWAWHLDQWWQQGMAMDQLMENASVWCCQNIDSLITRHLHGHRVGLAQWPKQWGQWSHYQQGEVEFKQTVNKA